VSVSTTTDVTVGIDVGEAVVTVGSETTLGVAVGVNVGTGVTVALSHAATRTVIVTRSQTNPVLRILDIRLYPELVERQRLASQ
jgi:hypothetical protein